MADIITKYVHRHIEGIYTLLKPGDEVPDWVTNPEAIRATPDPTAPVNVSLPTISGVFQVGETVTGDRGEWEDADSFSFRWNRNGSAISMATGETYTVQDDDAGKELTFTVTAKNGVGNTSATSAGETVSASEPEEEEPVETPPGEEDSEGGETLNIQVAAKTTTRKRRTTKTVTAEPTIQERAEKAGVTIAPNWTEAELEAAVLAAE